MATKKTTNTSKSSGSGKTSAAPAKTTRKSATPRATGSGKPSAQRTRRRTTAASVDEPMPARALQALILVLGVILLFSVFFGGRWGPAVVGLLVFGSAFPPVRRSVDRWLVGKQRGEEANEAALIRMGIGILIVVVSLAGLFTPG
jgi:hypothetical protein